MIFVTLVRFRGRMTKEYLQRTNKIIAGETSVKVLEFYWTLGRYDAVIIADAPDEKTVMKMLLEAGAYVATETMIAIPREEATKLL